MVVPFINWQDMGNNITKRILILYFSGVGNTKYVAETISSFIPKNYMIDIKSIEQIDENFDFSRYDKLILGTSTIHSEPAKPMKTFLYSIKRLTNPVPTFLFATYGFYPENVLRIFAKLCIPKNIIPIHYAGYRCRATDGMLLAPTIKFFRNNEKDLCKKIEQDVHKFINDNNIYYKKPKYKWYGLLNYPNKWLGQCFHFKIHLHKEHCIQCNKCMIKCPVGAIENNSDNYPNVDRKQCINCYRCIYHCPCKALSLSKNDKMKHIGT